MKMFKRYSRIKLYKPVSLLKFKKYRNYKLENIKEELIHIANIMHSISPYIFLSIVNIYNFPFVSVVECLDSKLH